MLLLLLALAAAMWCACGMLTLPSYLILVPLPPPAAASWTAASVLFIGYVVCCAVFVSTNSPCYYVLCYAVVLVVLSVHGRRKEQELWQQRLTRLMH